MLEPFSLLYPCTAPGTPGAALIPGIPERSEDWRRCGDPSTRKIKHLPKTGVSSLFALDATTNPHLIGVPHRFVRFMSTCLSAPSPYELDSLLFVLLTRLDVAEISS